MDNLRPYLGVLLDSELEALLAMLARLPLYGRELAGLTAHELDLALCEEQNRRTATD